MRIFSRRESIRKGGSGKLLPLLLSRQSITLQGATPLPYRTKRVSRNALDRLEKGEKISIYEVKAKRVTLLALTSITERLSFPFSSPVKGLRFSPGRKRFD